MLADLLDLALPRRCVGCGSPGRPFCADCRGTAAAVLVTGGVTPIVAAAAYADAIRTAVLAYKERGRRDLAAPLGGLLAEAVAALLDAVRAPPDRRLVLIPVPSTRAARTARGGDHLRRLARVAGGRCALRVAPGALRLVRAPRDSAGLGIADRAANLDHAMAAATAPPRWRALLVDDVVTTGATLREATRALTAGGWPVVGAAAVAATPRRTAGGVFPPIGSTQRTGLACERPDREV